MSETETAAEKGGCGCFACIGNEPAYEGAWLTVGMSQMIVCAECGNKRCPHGTDHRNECTGSNEPGQQGSRYGTALARVTAERDALAKQYYDNLSRLIDAEQQLGRCICEPFPHGSGPEECCGVHGRRYSEWVERGNVLQARLAAVKEVIAKARRTPAANDPYHVAMDIADDLEAAVYLDAVEQPQSIEDLRAALTAPPEDVECCASGRCEVCTPGYIWGQS